MKNRKVYIGTLQTTIIPFLLFVRKVGQVKGDFGLSKRGLKIPLTVMIRVKKVFAIMEIII